MEIPKHYSLHSEKDDHFVIHDERDGKKFKVAKKTMHPAHQLKIIKMKKYAEGGEVDPEDTGEDGIDEGAALSATKGLDSMPDLSKEESPVINESSPPQGIAAMEPQISAQPVAQPQQISPQVAPPNAAYPTSNELKSSIAESQAGIKAEATATQKLNENMAAQYQKNVAEEQKHMEMTQQKLAQYQAQYDQIFKDVQAGKIDPDHYMHSKSTGGKIAAAIGLILGGIGAGMTGGPNMALETLNKHIDNDIESQKANLGNKRSLLSENLRMQGNMMSAMTATRMQMQAIAQGKLAKVAAESGNPVVAARAQQAAAALQQSTIPARLQLANNEIQMNIRGEVLKRLAGQGQEGSQPVDMHDLARAGLVDRATAEKEASAISKRQQAEADVTDAATKLWKEQENFGGIGENYLPNIINPQAWTREDMLKSRVIQAIQHAAPSKRLNTEALALEIEPYIKNSFRTGKTREEGLNGLISTIRAHADPTPMATHYKIPGAIGGRNTTRKSFELGPVK